VNFDEFRGFVCFLGEMIAGGKGFEGEYYMNDKTSDGSAIGG